METRFPHCWAVLFAALSLTALLPMEAAAASRIPPQLVKDVRSLGLQRGPYVLGAVLTPKQLELAHRHALPPTADGTFRFKDGEIQVVAEKGSNVIIAISEYHPNWPHKKVKDLIGEFTLGFGFPTVVAHGKTLYWFYSVDKKLLVDQEYKDYVLQKGREGILATIKLQTGQFIEEDQGKGKDKGDDSPDSVYYVIYSNPILELFVHNNPFKKP